MKRMRLPDTRSAITVHAVHEGSHGLQDFYVTVGFYDDEGMRTTPGEVFVVIAKEGSDLRHMLNAWALSISIGLQYGVPWSHIVEKIKGTPGKPITESIMKAVDHAIQTRADIIGEQ